MTKQTPAELIAAMPHTLVYAHTTLYGVTVMPEKHAADCAACQFALALPAWEEHLVQVAIEITHDAACESVGGGIPIDKPITYADVLAEAKRTFGEKV